MKLVEVRMRSVQVKDFVLIYIETEIFVVCGSFSQSIIFVRKGNFISITAFPWQAHTKIPSGDAARYPCVTETCNPTSWTSTCWWRLDSFINFFNWVIPILSCFIPQLKINKGRINVPLFYDMIYISYSVASDRKVQSESVG